MRWHTPSDQTQLILALPVVIPAAALGALAVLPLLAWAKISDWLFPPHDWRRWFAWRPVKIDNWWNGERDCWAWLETIERQRWGSGLWRQHDYRLASAIEAATAGETGNTGSTEGESATRQGDAQGPSQ